MTTSDDHWLSDYKEQLKDQKILQLNCQSGEDTKYICEIASSVTAMDEDISSVWQLPMFHPNLKVEQIDLNAEFLLSETQFDHIVAGFCLSPYTVEDGRKIVNKFHQLLKKDGMIIGRLLSNRQLSDNPERFEALEDGLHQKDGEIAQYYDKNMVSKLFGNRWAIEISNDGKDVSRNETLGKLIEFTATKLR